MDAIDQAGGAQQLRAIKIAGRITNDRRLELTLPPVSEAVLEERAA